MFPTGPNNKNPSRQQELIRIHSNNVSLCKHFIELIQSLFLTVSFFSPSCHIFCLMFSLMNMPSVTSDNAKRKKKKKKKGLLCVCVYNLARKEQLSTIQNRTAKQRTI